MVWDGAFPTVTAVREGDACVRDGSVFMWVDHHGWVRAYNDCSTVPERFYVDLADGRAHVVLNGELLDTVEEHALVDAFARVKEASAARADRSPSLQPRRRIAYIAGNKDEAARAARKDGAEAECFGVRDTPIGQFDHLVVVRGRWVLELGHRELERLMLEQWAPRLRPGGTTAQHDGWR